MGEGAACRLEGDPASAFVGEALDCGLVGDWAGWGLVGEGRVPGAVDAHPTDLARALFSGSVAAGGGDILGADRTWRRSSCRDCVLDAGSDDGLTCAKKYRQP